MARRRMLIYRDYRGYTGGHGKFLDYAGHIDAHPDWQALVYLTAGSTGVDNPFLDLPGRVSRWDPDDCDALLLGGMDWDAVPATGNVARPIVNLLQHVRHADSASPLRAFLPRRAIRVGNSVLVSEAVRATGEANGPLLTITSGVDLARLAEVGRKPVEWDVFVDAAKQPELGRALAQRLQGAGLRVRLHVARTPFADYLDAMASAAIALPLPDPAEGLYLPGLDAMAMGRVLVQPDCVGSRAYARDGDNALVPARAVDALADAALRVHADAALRERLVAAARSTVAGFGLAEERRQVHRLLDHIDELWGQ